MVRRGTAETAVVALQEKGKPEAPGDVGGCFGFLFGLAVAFPLLPCTRAVDAAMVVTQRSIFCSKAASASVSESESGLDVRSALSDEISPEERLSVGPLLDELSELSVLEALAASGVAGGGGRV